MCNRSFLQGCGQSEYVIYKSERNDEGGEQTEGGCVWCYDCIWCTPDQETPGRRCVSRLLVYTINYTTKKGSSIVFLLLLPSLLLVLVHLLGYHVNGVIKSAKMEHHQFLYEGTVRDDLFFY